MYPRLFQFGPVAVPTYGVFAAAALIAGLTLATRVAARLGLQPNQVWNFGLTGVCSAVIGSRLLLISGNWHDFVAYPMVMLTIPVPRTTDTVLLEIGLGIFAGLLYLTLKKMPWLRALDAAAPGWALGQAILMLGCFLAGCDYGLPTAMPWGVAFHSRWALLWNGTPLETRLHPTQLYFFLLQALLCLGLLWWLPRRKQAGEMAGIWLLISGLAQFFLDFFRGDNRPMILGDALSLMQAIDFCMVVAGAVLLLRHSSLREIEYAQEDV